MAHKIHCSQCKLVYKIQDSKGEDTRITDGHCDSCQVKNQPDEKVVKQAELEKILNAIADKEEGLNKLTGAISKYEEELKALQKKISDKTKELEELDNEISDIKNKKGAK